MATTYSAQAEEEKKKYNQIYDKQKEQINLNADANIKDLDATYDEQQRAIEVQKLINERKVAESMANLGLTDSGLNRTQQTAVQLSAANQRYALNRERDAAINKINLERNNQISTIEQNKLATDLEIDNTYNQMQQKAVEDAAQTDLTSSYVISANNAALNRLNVKGSLADSGVTVIDNGNGTKTYLDNNSGYKTTLKSTVNPYTGENNVWDKESNTNASITAKSGTEYGYFSNGYQPKGVYGVGAFSKETAGSWNWPDGRNGNKPQNVFKIVDKKGKTTYWVWDGSKNEYFKVKNAGADINGNIIWEEV